MSTDETKAPLFNVYVVWRMDEDDFFFTLLQFEDTDMQRQAMQQWSVLDYVRQAFDATYPDVPNLFQGREHPFFECIGIFEGNIRFLL
jgi:hypothetical protein